MLSIDHIKGQRYALPYHLAKIHVEIATIIFSFREEFFFDDMNSNHKADI
jgi:hypothetical protein